MKPYLQYIFPMYLFCPWMILALPLVAAMDVTWTPNN